MNKSKGFTIIELLVVIAMISLLSSVIFSSLNSARAKARDARRRADLKQIYTALQLYFDQYGYLPTADSYGGADHRGWDYSSQGDFLPFLRTAGILSTAPKDPLNNGVGDVLLGGSGYSYAYYCYTAQNSLSLGAKMETDPTDGYMYWIATQELGFKCQ